MAPLWELEDQGLLRGSSDDLCHLARQIRSNDAFLDRLMAAIVECEYVWPKSVHLEEQIYDGFVSDKDAALCQRFHQIPWEDRPELITSFEDMRLFRLSRRLIYHERPDLLDRNHLASMRDEVRRRVDGSIADAPWLTIPTALSQIQDILNQPISAQELEDLERLREHLSIALGMQPAA
jgi:exodeoxyribonuclease-1